MLKLTVLKFYRDESHSKTFSSVNEEEDLLIDFIDEDVNIALPVKRILHVCVNTLITIHFKNIEWIKHTSPIGFPFHMHYTSGLADDSPERKKISFS